MSAMAIRRLTGRHVLYLLLGFFGLVFLVNGIFIYVALDSFSGVSTEHSYAKGVAYNETLEAGRAQQALGWRTNVIAGLQAGGDEVEIVVTLNGPDGRAVTGLLLDGVLRRPVEARDDKALVFAEGADGRYRAVAPVAQLGNWDLLLTTTAPDGTPVQLETRLWLKSSN